MSQNIVLVLLKNKTFFLFWLGFIGYGLGNALFTISLNWWVYITTGSEVQLGIVGTLNFLSMMIFSLLSGILVDKFHRKKIIFLSIILRGIIILCFPIFGIFGWLQLWIVYLIAFTQYITFPFFVNAINAIMPQFIEKEHLMTANALVDSAYWFSTFIGFLSGGFLIDFFGIYTLIFMSVIIFLITPFLFVKIPYTFQKRGGKVNFLNFMGDIKDGFGQIFKDKVLFIMVFTWTGLIILFSTGATNIGWPVFSRVILSAGAEGYGLLVSASSLSAMMGSIFLSVYGSKMKMGRLFLFGLLLGGIGMIIFSMTTTLSISLVIIFLTFFHFPMVNVPYWTALQHRVPEEELGKVSGATFTVNTGLSPISTFLTGIMMERVSVTLPFVLSGCSYLASFFIAFSNKKLRNLD